MKTPLACCAALLVTAGSCKDSLAPNPSHPIQPPGAGSPSSPYAPTLPPEQRQPPKQAFLAAPPDSLKKLAAAPGGATFGGGAVRYLGYEWAPAQPFAGGVMRLTHYWKVEKPLPGDWEIFVHLERPGQPGVVVNADHVAIQGTYPTSLWKAGQIFRDDELLRLPPQLPGKALDMFVGLFQGDARLPLDDPKLGQENRLHVGEIPLGEGPSAALPVYEAVHTTGPIRIDGKLDEPDWKRAATVTLVRSLDGGPTKAKTQAKLLWDDANLYVAFVCEDKDIWSSYTKHDEPLYNQEAVELFVDADGDGKTYNELELSPANVTFDAYFPARRQGMDMTWESGMKTAVVVDGTLNDPSDVDRGWTAELSVPIAKLAAVPHVPPLPGDRWRINLYRLDWSDNRKTNEGSAFSPLFQPDFHNLPRFGWLEFKK
ncbi:MAG: carbohydrate-binding family 9-like protein [Deltaproteobacteria bacterium]